MTGFVTNVGLKPNIGVIINASASMVIDINVIGSICKVLSRPLMFAVGGSKGELRVFNKNGAGFVELFSHNQYDPNGKSAKCVCALYLTTEHKRSNAPTGADFDRREGMNAVTVATRSGMLARMRSARSSSNISHANSENDNGFLAVGSRSGLVECWDVAKQECIFSTGLGHAEGHTGRVNSLIIIMDGSGRYPNLLFSGGNDGAARLYDLRSKRCCLVINNDGGPVTCVLGACFGAGSRILYVASSDGVVRCFSFKNGEIVRLIRTFRGHFDRIMSMEFLTDNNEDIIKTCSRDGTVRYTVQLIFQYRLTTFIIFQDMEHWNFSKI